MTHNTHTQEQSVCIKYMAPWTNGAPKSAQIRIQWNDNGKLIDAYEVISTFGADEYADRNTNLSNELSRIIKQGKVHTTGEEIAPPHKTLPAMLANNLRTSNVTIESIMPTP